MEPNETQSGSLLLVIERPAPTSKFLGLPLELRRMIYSRCFATPGGYVYDLASRKLKQANGQPINLSLMRTCSQTNKELPNSDFIFEANPLTFRTACSTQHPDLAPGWFDYLISKIHEIQHSMLVRPDPTMVVRGPKYGAQLLPGMDQSTYSTLSSSYPVFQPYWDTVHNPTSPVGAFSIFDTQKRAAELEAHQGKAMSHSVSSSLHDLSCPGQDWGEVPSLKRKAVGEFARLQSASNPQYDVNSFFSDRVTTRQMVDRAVSALITYKPWHLPTKKACEDLWQHLKVDMHRDELLELWAEGDNFHHSLPNKAGTRRDIKTYVSAVSIFIDCMTNHFPDHLKDRALREVILKEDRLGVAMPECHGLGLIPLAGRYPTMRISRRVNLWRTVLQTNPFGTNDPELLLDQAYRAPRQGSLEVHRVSRPVDIWAHEAHHLLAEGMPAGIFQLIFDAGPAPAAATRVFEEGVMRAGAWHDAFILSMSPGGSLPSLSELDRRQCSMYISRDFPMRMRALINSGPGSIVRCNFSFTQMWAADIVARANSDLTLEVWMWAWHDYGQLIHLGPNLPPWETILEENFL